MQEAYPRLCAHRGLHDPLPENSLPAFAAAVALGASEIEFDLWLTRDGHWVSTHDPNLDRVSNGTGPVADHTLEQLRKLSFGRDGHPAFGALPVLTFSDILEQFARRCIFNIHIKTADNGAAFDPKALEALADAIYAYGIQDRMYFMSTDPVLEKLRQIAPSLPRCCGSWIYPEKIVARAEKLACTRIQLTKPKFTAQTIRQAHEAGLHCNLFWSDDPEEAAGFLDMGIDTILTNQYWTLRRGLAKRGFGHVK